MKTEYLFTDEQKAELANIDRQIAELCRKKCDIYLHAQCRYIIDYEMDPDEFNSIGRFLNYGEPLFPKEVITIKVEEKENEP